MGTGAFQLTPPPFFCVVSGVFCPAPATRGRVWAGPGQPGASCHLLKLPAPQRHQLMEGETEGGEPAPCGELSKEQRPLSGKYVFVCVCVTGGLCIFYVWSVGAHVWVLVFERYRQRERKRDCVRKIITFCNSLPQLCFSPSVFFLHL